MANVPGTMQFEMGVDLEKNVLSVACAAAAVAELVVEAEPEVVEVAEEVEDEVTDVVAPEKEEEVVLAGE